MSYQLISLTRPKAKKIYNCIWCIEKINKNMVYIREISTYYGDFQNRKWHSECYNISQIYFRKSKEEEFSPHECKRGSLEHV